MKHMQGIEKCFLATLSKITKKTQLSTHMLYFLQQSKHGVEPGQITAVNSSQVLNAANGIDRFFRESHHLVRWLKNRLHKAGTAIDKYGAARNGCKMRGGIKTVKDVWLWLIHLKSAGCLPVRKSLFVHEVILGLKVEVVANDSHNIFCSGVLCEGTWRDTSAYRSP